MYVNGPLCQRCKVSLSWTIIIVVCLIINISLLLCLKLIFLKQISILISQIPWLQDNDQNTDS